MSTVLNARARPWTPPGASWTGWSYRGDVSGKTYDYIVNLVREFGAYPLGDEITGHSPRP